MFLGCYNYIHESVNNIIIIIAISYLSYLFLYVYYCFGNWDSYHFPFGIDLLLIFKYLRLNHFILQSLLSQQIISPHLDHYRYKTYHLHWLIALCPFVTPDWLLVDDPSRSLDDVTAGRVNQWPKISGNKQVTKNYSDFSTQLSQNDSFPLMCSTYRLGSFLEESNVSKQKLQYSTPQTNICVYTW